MSNSLDPDLSGLIWVQTVCQGRLSADDTGRLRVNAHVPLKDAANMAYSVEPRPTPLAQAYPSEKLRKIMLHVWLRSRNPLVLVFKFGRKETGHPAWIILRVEQVSLNTSFKSV